MAKQQPQPSPRTSLRRCGTRKLSASQSRTVDIDIAKLTKSMPRTGETRAAAVVRRQPPHLALAPEHQQPAPRRRHRGWRGAAQPAAAAVHILRLGQRGHEPADAGRAGGRVLQAVGGGARSWLRAWHSAAAVMHLLHARTHVIDGLFCLHAEVSDGSGARGGDGGRGQRHVGRPRLLPAGEVSVSGCTVCRRRAWGPVPNLRSRAAQDPRHAGCSVNMLHHISLLPQCVAADTCPQTKVSVVAFAAPA